MQVQGGGERGGTRGGLRLRRRGCADFPGAVQRVRGLQVGAEQHVLQVPVRGAPGDAARRHLPLHGRQWQPAPPLSRRVQLLPVHRGGREPRCQGERRHAAVLGLPPQLWRLYWLVMALACAYLPHAWLTYQLTERTTPYEN
jgi:hypothetical protein